MAREWTTEEVLSSKWLRDNAKEPAAVKIAPGRYGDNELQIVTTQDLVAEAHKQNLPPSNENILWTISRWASRLGYAEIHSIQHAQRSLPRTMLLDTLGDWFNGGPGLPCNKDEPDLRLYLNHPSILQNFLNWLVSYLSLHDTCDARISRDGEAMINQARQLRGLPPIRRY